MLLWIGISTLVLVDLFCIGINYRIFKENGSLSDRYYSEWFGFLALFGIPVTIAALGYYSFANRADTRKRLVTAANKLLDKVEEKNPSLRDRS